MNSAYQSVTTTAAVCNTDTNEAPQFGGGLVIIKVPSGGATVYVGGSDVTADTTAGTGGFPVAAGESLTVGYGPSEGVYVRVASGTQNINVLRQGAN